MYSPRYSPETLLLQSRMRFRTAVPPTAFEVMIVIPRVRKGLAGA